MTTECLLTNDNNDTTPNITTAANNNNNNNTNNNSIISLPSSRHTKNFSNTSTYLDYDASSFDEGEESDSYEIIRGKRFDPRSDNHHRWSISSSSSNSTTLGLNYLRHNNNGNNNNNNMLLSTKSIYNNSRIRAGRKWETDDEIFKPNHNRHSLPSIHNHHHHHQQYHNHSFNSSTTNSPTNTNISTASSSNTTNSNNINNNTNNNNNSSINNGDNNNNNNNNNIDETNTTRSLLYLLNKEREKRRELQTAYDQTLKSLQDLQKSHMEDINALESDVQTLRKALVKEAKVKVQLNKLFNEAQEKFADEMKVWATKVMEMENQGNELQDAFKETIIQLEKGEIETSRLREENQILRDQLSSIINNNNDKGGNNGINNHMQSFMKIINNDSSNSTMVVEHDEISKESKNTNDPIESSDAESVVTCSKITKLNDRIMELENELSTTKENNLKIESSFQELESEKQVTIKQLEEKHEKQVTLLRATIAQKQKIIDNLNQELRKVRYSEGKKEQKLLLKQNNLNNNNNLVNNNNNNNNNNSNNSNSKEEKEKQGVVVEHSEPVRPSTPLNNNSNNSSSNNNNVNSINKTNQSRLPKPRRSSTMPIISHPSSLPTATKDRKSSLASSNSTNSGSAEIARFKNSPSVEEEKEEEKIEGEGEGEHSELFSEEEEEGDKSSAFTGSENWAQSRIGSEENASLQDQNNELGEDDNNSNSVNSNGSSNINNTTATISTTRNPHGRTFIGNGSNNNVKVIVENEDDMLDAILSDMEDRNLPLIGHYSAAEYTEDEDYSSVMGGDDDLFDRSISRRQSVASRFSGGGRNTRLKFK